MTDPWAQLLTALEVFASIFGATFVCLCGINDLIRRRP